MSETAPIKVVFLGTPAFALPTLEALLTDARFAVLGVVTQPDKPAGRGKKLTPPPVKERALAAGLPVHQPKSIRKDETVKAWLRALAPDFMVTAAFGQILSQEVLDIPKRGTVNVHASLLPRWRGANPVQWSILAGDAETGVTTMLTDIGVDTGDMLLKAATGIGTDETAETLVVRLAELGGPLLTQTLLGLVDGGVQPIPQDDAEVTHAPKLNREAAQIDWRKPAADLHRQIRGQLPWPGAQTVYLGEPVKLLGASLGTGIQVPDLPAGTILGVRKNPETGGEGLAVMTGMGALLVTQLQPAGKKAMAARDWANGAFGPALKAIDPTDAATYPRFELLDPVSV